MPENNSLPGPIVPPFPYDLNDFNLEATIEAANQKMREDGFVLIPTMTNPMCGCMPIMSFKD